MRAAAEDGHHDVRGQARIWKQAFGLNIGALIIKIGFWGPLYYNPNLRPRFEGSGFEGKVWGCWLVCPTRQP